MQKEPFLPVTGMYSLSGPPHPGDAEVSKAHLSPRYKSTDYARTKSALGLSNRQNKIRINSAGCLDRCDDGPVLVIYPEGIWYSFVDESDLDEIIESHLKNGQVVERLKI